MYARAGFPAFNVLWMKNNKIDRVSSYKSSMVNAIKEEKRSKYKMKTKKILVVLFGVLLSAIGPIVIGYGLILADNETKAMTGKLLPFKIDSQKLIEIQIGGFHVMITMNELSEGFNLRQIIDLGFDYPFQIKPKDRKILFSVDINNADNETIATVVDNHWGVNNNKVIAHDRNYNSYALEVIDSHLLPVIQIHFTTGNKLYVGGVFYLSNATMLATNDTTIINPLPAEINSSLPRIFKYPSEQHLGEMVVDSPYRVARTSTQVIIIGGILLALGILLVVYDRIISEKEKKQRQLRDARQAERRRWQKPKKRWRARKRV